MNNAQSTRRMTIDAMQYSNWNREIFEEWRAADLACAHVTVSIWEDARETLHELGKWATRINQNSDILAPVRSVADLDQAYAEGKTGVIFGFQNSSPFEDDIRLVETFHDLGVKFAQPTYNIQTLVGGSCYEPTDSGLSRYGALVVGEMNRVGMIPDLSHSGVRTASDILDVSTKPVVYTHANPRFFYDHPRNVPNDLLKKVAASGGAVGLAPYPHLTPDDCSVEDFCAMAARVVELIGVEHVAIGTDTGLGHADGVLDWIRMGTWTIEKNYGAGSAANPGWAPLPSWYGGTKDLPDLFSALEKHGFSSDEVDLIAGGNWRRVFVESFVDAAPAADVA
jgi:membrane dipeptidase